MFFLRYIYIYNKKRLIMKKIVRLTENDLTRIVKRVLKEQVDNNNPKFIEDVLLNKFFNKVAPNDKYINNVKSYLKDLPGTSMDSKMEQIKNALPTLDGKSLDEVKNMYMNFLVKDLGLSKDDIYLDNNNIEKVKNALMKKGYMPKS